MAWNGDGRRVVLGVKWWQRWVAAAACACACAREVCWLACPWALVVERVPMALDLEAGSWCYSNIPDVVWLRPGSLLSPDVIQAPHR